VENNQRSSIDRIAKLAGCDLGAIRRYVAAGIFDLDTLDEADVTG